MIKKQDWIVTASLLCFLTPNCFAQPLKVFILAGQSKMEGRQAGILTLDQFGERATIGRQAIDNPNI